MDLKEIFLLILLLVLSVIIIIIIYCICRKRVHKNNKEVNTQIKDKSQSIHETKGTVGSFDGPINVSLSGADNGLDNDNRFIRQKSKRWKLKRTVIPNQQTIDTKVDIDCNGLAYNACEEGISIDTNIGSDSILSGLRRLFDSKKSTINSRKSGGLSRNAPKIFIINDDKEVFKKCDKYKEKKRNERYNYGCDGDDNQINGFAFDILDMSNNTESLKTNSKTDVKLRSKRKSESDPRIVGDIETLDYADHRNESLNGFSFQYIDECVNNEEINSMDYSVVNNEITSHLSRRNSYIYEDMDFIHDVNQIIDTTFDNLIKNIDKHFDDK
ncbi:uncharacterized protein LOC128963171 isoform X2 [Oppia nitens]|uniref:uncharacterized protein LOC128963171 isoform X2 n=1 Tax=Oppia nitens TaxID=1686743 RepID=UPI0023DC6C6B|nr:uncharacterized protein LOC128963171 isoform X2 [Oppia nitens]